MIIRTSPPALQARRRRLLLGLGIAPFVAPARAAGAPIMTVWKSPTCGCCKDWIAHIEAAGIRTYARDTGNAAARARLGVPPALGSCHTGEIQGYAIEGHVPAREVLRLLRERPRAAGLAVPGMPVGSPGMDGPVYGDRKDPYDVLLVAHGGATRVYQAYR
jgi:hypothetical protein